MRNKQENEKLINMHFPDGMVLDAGHINPTFDKNETYQSFSQKKDKNKKENIKKA
jgi:hypothetical protein